MLNSCYLHKVLFSDLNTFSRLKYHGSVSQSMPNQSFIRERFSTMGKCLINLKTYLFSLVEVRNSNHRTTREGITTPPPPRRRWLGDAGLSQRRRSSHSLRPADPALKSIPSSIHLAELRMRATYNLVQHQNRRDGLREPLHNWGPPSGSDLCPHIGFKSKGSNFL